MLKRGCMLILCILLFIIIIPFVLFGVSAACSNEGEMCGGPSDGCGGLY